jgi:hypothetical protein
MLKTVVVLVAACLVGCGEEAPSCQQAVTHYYDAGCKLVNLATGTDFTKNEIIADCRNTIATFPARCEGELEDLRFCFDSVPSPAKTNADCDCSQEQDALATCR